MPMNIETIKTGPYRLFFPLGILFGLIGVGHWVFWSIGWIPESPGFAHALLQTQGFLACFVVGFLMTAFPRFSGTRIAGTGDLVLSLAAALLFLVFSLMGNWFAAELAFLGLMGVLFHFVRTRATSRTKNPPPSFLLIGFGLLQSILGPIFILASGMGTKSYALFETGRQMLQLGFLLCAVLGVAGHLAPYLLGYAEEPGQEEAGKRSWRSGLPAIAIHGMVGALILASFFFNPHYEDRMHWAAGLRAFLVAAHMMAYARIWRPLKRKTVPAFFFYLSCWAIPIGFWTAFLLPVYRVAALHVIFIGGFSLMIFSFGMIVVLSHSGKAALINTRLIPLRIVGVFALLALGTRFAADFFPFQYKSFIHTASGFWVLAATVWLGYAIPKLWPKAEPPHQTPFQNIKADNC